MYGLEAVSYANGWAMAAVGATIVITGLSVLSCLISQFHHFVGFFEDKDTIPKNEIVNKDKNITDKNIPKVFSGGIDKISKTYISLTNDQLGDTFYLTDLYKVSNKMRLPHPHISIRDFRNSGILISLGEGRFSWKSISA